MMKKMIAVAMAAMLALSMTACGSKPASSAAGSTATGSTATGSTATVEGLKEAIAEQPALLTSVGQSADVEMVKVMMDKAELKYSIDNMSDGSDLGDAKTLVLAIGGSSKGLGAAGIDADQEIARVEKLINAADEAGLTILALHIGGEARRGDLSDKFIAPCFTKADYAIVVKEGNKDGMMTELASKAGIPMDEVTSMGEVLTPLKAAFK